jgi:hypothetical protein
VVVVVDVVEVVGGLEAEIELVVELVVEMEVVVVGGGGGTVDFIATGLASATVLV